MDRHSLLALRRAFAGLRETSHKQMGLRAIRDAIATLDRGWSGANQAARDAHVAGLVAKATFHLSYARAVR